MTFVTSHAIVKFALDKLRSLSTGCSVLAVEQTTQNREKEKVGKRRRKEKEKERERKKRKERLLEKCAKARFSRGPSFLLRCGSLAAVFRRVSTQRNPTKIRTRNGEGGKRKSKRNR